eukprot:8397043-Ditylum_brightwellii.AAC.2
MFGEGEFCDGIFLRYMCRPHALPSDCGGYGGWGVDSSMCWTAKQVDLSQRNTMSSETNSALLAYMLTYQQQFATNPISNQGAKEELHAFRGNGGWNSRSGSKDDV